jgi:phage terminase small subunit
MKKADWKREIVKKCESVGTYKKEFLPVINTLADILEERDRVRTQYRQEGSQPVVEFVSDRGAVNKRKNPLLLTWEDLNKDALAYWKELGLTPAGLRKLNTETAKGQEAAGSLEKLLAGLGDS